MKALHIMHTILYIPFKVSNIVFHQSPAFPNFFHHLKDLVLLLYHITIDMHMDQIYWYLFLANPCLFSQTLQPRPSAVPQSIHPY